MAIFWKYQVVIMIQKMTKMTSHDAKMTSHDPHIIEKNNTKMDEFVIKHVELVVGEEIQEVDVHNVG